MTSRSWWNSFKRVLTLAFFALVAWLLVSQARSIDWDKVGTALVDYPVTVIGGAVLLAVASYVLYSCFDLLGRHYTGHKLGKLTVMTITFVSYAFNLNLGSLIGGVAFRYRLYSRLGIENSTITRIMAISMLTNWMGYLLLGGLVFAVQPPTPPADWSLTASGLHWIGFALLAVVAAYITLCALSKKRTYTVRGHALDLPSLRLAGLQLLMGAGNWLLMSGIIFILFQQKIEFSAVVSVLLLAAIAGVVTHVPAGLGVLEAVFVALLSHQMPAHEILASLVAYRLLYYIAPLVIAAVVYLVKESQAKKTKKITKKHLEKPF